MSTGTIIALCIVVLAIAVLYLLAIRKKEGRQPGEDIADRLASEFDEIKQRRGNPPDNP